MDQHPGEIKFVKRFPLNETFEEFDVWLREIEDHIHIGGEEFDEVIAKCKMHYGDEFSEIFDEEKLPLLFDNFWDIVQYENQRSLMYD